MCHEKQGCRSSLQPPLLSFINITYRQTEHSAFPLLLHTDSPHPWSCLDNYMAVAKQTEVVTYSLGNMQHRCDCRTWRRNDGRELLLDTPNGLFLLETGKFTPQGQRINMSSKKTSILEAWQKEKETKILAQTRNLPSELQDLLQRKTSQITFSPDENKILYTASSSGILNSNLMKPIPGASTQTENRDIKIDHTYVYDIKEDRNFLIDGAKKLFWLPNSRNLVSAEDNKIIIMDYDGTNKQVVFSGGYSSPYVFPYLNGEKLLILTNLGADSQVPNLYSISIK